MAAKDLVVTSDDDDADASKTTVLDGINHLHTRRIQHANDTNKRAARLQTHIKVMKYISLIIRYLYYYYYYFNLGK